ncbi:hypothetical protein BASA83_007287 [Batrachochytrium salamandrivorans]|nr:hypothetical protein BASA83_007287 [Batrachochytrium salamandrivorans]
MGKAYYGLELVWWQHHTLPHCKRHHKGIRLFTVPDSRLPLDPFWLKLDWVTSPSLIGITGTLLERSVTKRTPINAICSGTDNDVFTLNGPRAVGKIPALVLVSSDQTAYTGTDTG